MTAPASKSMPKSTPALNLATVSHQYQVQVWNDALGGYQDQETLSSVELQAGQLFVGGYPIVHPVFEPNGVNWSQKTPGAYCSGFLHFTSDGLAFAGLIYRGVTEQSAVPYNVSGAVPPTTYTSQVANTGTSQPSSEAPADSQWETGVTVTIGYKPSKKGHLPTQVIDLAGQDVSSLVSMTIDPTNGNLQLQLLFDPDIAQLGYGISPLWPASCQIEFAWNGLSFSGYMQEYDPTTGEVTTDYFAWQGQTPAQVSSAAAVAATLLTTDAVAPQIQATQTLSIAELISISPSGVRNMSFDMLVQNMKWAMNPTWLTEFFAETQPVLDQTRIELINKNLDFYQNKFAAAYLGLGFANMTGPGAPSKPLTPAQLLALQYYMYNGLAQEKGYNMQSNGLFLQAFVLSSPRLQDFINDGGDKWAKKLYDAITTVPQMNLMINRIIADGHAGNTLANRYATLLAALQPSGELAMKYHKTIALRSLSEISDTVNLDDKTQIMTWLPQVIQEFINQYLVAPTNPTKEQLERQAMAQELKEAAEQIGSVSDLAGAFADALVASVGATLVQRTENAEDAFSAKFPKLAKAGRFLMVGAWMGGLYSAIIGFEHWDDLSNTEKAALILAVVDLFGDLILAVPKILEAGSVGLEEILLIRNYFSGSRMIVGMEVAVVAVDEDWFSRGAKAMQGFFDAAKKAITTEGTFWGKMFKNLATAMKWLGAAISAAFAVISTIQFINDIKDGAPVQDEAFDGIIAASNIAETVCIVIDLAVTDTVFAAAGAIFAVIGVVFTLVEAFVPQPKPESPVDKFMSDTLDPFIAKLPTPPTGWSPGAQPQAQLA